MDKLICKKYADALFELAEEQSKCAILEQQTLPLIAALEDNSTNLKRFLAHPGIDPDDKVKVIKAAFEELDIDLEFFLLLVFQKDRGDMVLPILSTFVELTRAQRGVVTASIVSAQPLSDEQLDRLVDVLQKKLNKTVEPSVSVDSSLIGGIKVTVCGHTINSTIKSRLYDVKTLMSEGKTTDERRGAE